MNNVQETISKLLHLFTPVIPYGILKNACRWFNYLPYYLF